jgi:hypothetical protein
MLPSRVLFSESESSRHARSSADFTTTTSGFRFPVHTGVAPLDQRTALPDQCLHSAEADVRPPRKKSGVDPSATSTGLKFRSVAVACAISFVPKRGKALSSQTAHGHQAPRPSVFAQDDGRRTEPATTELRRMVPRVGARPNAA